MCISTPKKGGGDKGTIWTHTAHTRNQCCGSGSGIRCLFDPWIRDPVPFWPLDPGSGISFSLIPDLGSRIPNPYFWELCDNFFGKKFCKSLKIGANFFLRHLQTIIIINFVKSVLTWKVWQHIFSTPIFCCCFWIRDPGWVSIRIRDKHPGSATLHGTLRYLWLAE